MADTGLTDKTWVLTFRTLSAAAVLAKSQPGKWCFESKLVLPPRLQLTKEAFASAMNGTFGLCLGL